MKRVKLMIVALAVVFLAGSFSFAQAQDREQDRSLRQQQGKMFKELGLSAEQQEKLEQNRKKQRQEYAVIMTAIREKQEKLQSQLKDPKVTWVVLQPLIAEIKSLQARMIDRKIIGIFAVKGILTPEQFIKFQEKTEKLHKGRKSRFQERQKSRIDKRCYKG